MSSVILSGDTSGTVTLTVPSVAGTNTATLPAGTGTIAVQGVSTNIVSGTAVASTSGTSITFSSIPSWAKKVTLMLSGVTISGSTLVLRIGSGSIENTGYTSTAFGVANTGNLVTALSGGTSLFQLTSVVVSSGVYNGTVVLTLLNSSTNLWTSNGNLTQTGGGFVGGFGSAGSKAISGGALAQIQLLTNSGTDTFSAGSINILYE